VVSFLIRGGPMEAAELRWITGGGGLRSARDLRDAVGMVEAASRQNKGAGARSPSRQGHLWRRRRAASLVFSQICGFGEVGLSRCNTLLFVNQFETKFQCLKIRVN
jgi:hypothetical protein